MPVTKSANLPWLLLLFRLPSSRASQRVEVWRKLRRYGTLALRSSGHVLPNTPANQEKLEWLARSIRAYKGQASVVQVQVFDDLPDVRLRQLFIESRSQDYQRLLRTAKKLLAIPPVRRPASRLTKLRRQFQEVAAIDFFDNPLRSRLEMLMARADNAPAAPVGRSGKGKASTYRNRVWITRPRPGIDRVSSAWLIRKYIDPRARFVFASDPDAHPGSIPFDMFHPQGFGHRGEDCTFETLCREFSIRDAPVRRIAQIIHDADLGDEKFGRIEGLGLDQVLNGWARQDVADDDLLRRGMELIEGLYYSSD
jgi:hypothetical protein